jgi:hypothetical protein
MKIHKKLIVKLRRTIIQDVYCPISAVNSADAKLQAQIMVDTGVVDWDNPEVQIIEIACFTRWPTKTKEVSNGRNYSLE